MCVRYVHIFFLLSSFFPLTAHVHRWRRLGGVDSMRRVPLLLWPSPRLHLRLRCRLRRGSEDTVQHQVRPPVRRRNRFMYNIQCVWRTRKYVHLEMKRFTLRLTPFTPELHILFYYFQVQCRHLAHGPVLGLEVLPRARLRGNLHGRLWGVAGEYPEERTDGGVKGKVREYVVS